MENPIGGAYAGWNLAKNLIIFSWDMEAHILNQVRLNPCCSEAGIKTLNLMKALSEYMNPDFLTHDSNATNAEYRAGNIALLNMWGSRQLQLLQMVLLMQLKIILSDQ